ncbi:phosphotransferase family enzyme [Novosphingobium sp. PhB165]|uniref:phosphotransferase n=1 Tax=Novosphingobium sp. PhB165 TaxID=2485105 RepID=UPI001044B3DE|nr:phosphotransferase [Novosphingobium sp. PhB165]TCM19547.1 phosphotransferase family enzyme [Novosphingobium sp. PhB165]
MTITAARLPEAPLEHSGPVPATLAEALDPQWLAPVLAHLSGDRAIVAVETVEVIRTVATKVRFAVQFEGEGEAQRFCLKGLLDVDAATARGGPTCVLEADFYNRLAPVLDLRVPPCVATVVDREAQQAVTVMRDLIAQGAMFCSALDPFGADDAAASLGLLAQLHARADLLEGADWIAPRAAQLARMDYVTPEMLQDLLDGPRGEGIAPEVRNANRLAAAMRALAQRDAGRPDFLLHGDAHAGNLFRASEGMGLIDWQLLQRGGWALDVAYHLNAVLPVDVAEAEERRLLGEYLAAMRGHGCAMPDAEEAWTQYREAVVYGYYLWSITRRVDPPIIEAFVGRLGRAVMRHDSFALLGV